MDTSPPRSASSFPRSGQLLRAAAEALRLEIPRSLHRSAVRWTDAATRRTTVERIVCELALDAGLLGRRSRTDVLREACDAIEEVASRWDAIGDALHEPRVSGDAARFAAGIAGRFLVIDLAVRAGAWMAMTGSGPLDVELVRAYRERRGSASWLERRARAHGLGVRELARSAKASEKTVRSWMAAPPRRPRLPRPRNVEDLGCALAAGGKDHTAAARDTRFAIAGAEIVDRCAEAFGTDVAASWVDGFAAITEAVREKVVGGEHGEAWELVMHGVHASAGGLGITLLPVALRAASLPVYYALCSARSNWTLPTSFLLRGASISSAGKMLHVQLRPESKHRRLDWIGIRLGEPLEFTFRPTESGDVVPFLLATIETAAKEDPTRLESVCAGLGFDTAAALFAALRHDDAAAVEHAARAQRNAPWNQVAAEVLADANLRLARPADALEALAGASDAEAAIWRRRGLAHAASGRLRSALNALRRAEALDPEHPGIIAALADVLSRLAPRTAVKYRRRAGRIRERARR